MNLDIAAQLRPFLQNLLNQNMDAQDLADNDSLFLSGRIDSFSLMQVIMHLEEKFQIDFSTVHFEASLLDSLADIVAFVQEHSKQSNLVL
jgi:acyl carrier protein